MTFNDDITDLINNLYRPSIFYAPESLFPNITAEMKQDLLDYGITNELVILKENGETKLYKNCIASLELLTKDKHLENNIFQLYKFKELQEDAFKFILDIYLKHVSTCEYIYEWLFNNLNDNIKEVTPEINSLFQLQYLSVLEHNKKLTELFGLKNQPEPKLVHENMSGVFSDEKVQKTINAITTENNNVVKNNSKPRRKKKELISIEDADKYLLETVFKVDLNSKTS